MTKFMAPISPNTKQRMARVDRITREITLQGDLTEEQRQSLLTIAEKCPVHRTLHAEVLVESRLAGD